MKTNTILIAGPPCSGKSTVGKFVSILLQAVFIDLDFKITQKSGHSVQWIFKHSGEAEFRTIEKQIFAEEMLNTERRTVITLGGGTLLDPASQVMAMKKAVVFTLFAPNKVLIARSNWDRPLAKDPLMLEKLILERTEHYKSLGNQIDTENRTAEQVAEIIAKAALPLLFPQDQPF